MKCKNDVLMNKIGLNKINDRTEVELTILNDLPDCKKINTKNFIPVEGVTSAYNYYMVPTNRFDCMKNGCVNTGTLIVNPAGEMSPGVAIFRAPFDATEFAAGIVTMYIHADSDEVVFPVEIRVAISSDENATNSDEYTVSVGEADIKPDGFAAIAIDLSKQPTTTVGTGWAPSAEGAYISVSSLTKFGVSSIAIFDDIEDFETTDVVVIGCISDLSGSFDVPATTSRCWGASYDTTNLSFDRTITGNKVTPNYWKLNPLHGKPRVTTSWISTTIEKTIVALNGFGAITIADMNQDECGFLGIQIADACNVTDSMLKRLALPNTDATIDERHYVAVANDNGSTTIYFNQRLVGQKVIVTYPKTVPVERIEGNKENVGDVRVRMAYKISQTDGAEFIYTFNNVLITSFPATITTDEPEFSFTVSIQPDDDGNYYTIDRVIV